MTTKYTQQCITCGADVEPMLFHGKVGGVSEGLALGEHWRLGLRRFRSGTKIRMMCDKHYSLWLPAALAHKPWTRKDAKKGVSLSVHGFELLARAFGLSIRTLKKRLRNAEARQSLQERRKRGDHRWAMQQAKAREQRERQEDLEREREKQWREHPEQMWMWIAAGVGCAMPGLLWSLGQIAEGSSPDPSPCPAATP